MPGHVACLTIQRIAGRIRVQHGAVGSGQQGSHGHAGTKRRRNQRRRAWQQHPPGNLVIRRDNGGKVLRRINIAVAFRRAFHDPAGLKAQAVQAADGLQLRQARKRGIRAARDQHAPAVIQKSGKRLRLIARQVTAGSKQQQNVRRGGRNAGDFPRMHLEAVRAQLQCQQGTVLLRQLSVTRQEVHADGMVRTRAPDRAD